MKFNCIILLLVLLMAFKTQARNVLNTSNGNIALRLALRGFYPLAYFAQQKPVVRYNQYVEKTQKVVYYFSSKAIKALFSKEPKKHQNNGCKWPKSRSKT